jgi:hypothetical protein
MGMLVRRHNRSEALTQIEQVARGCITGVRKRLVKHNRKPGHGR